jgi:hypothetical protein
VSVGPRKRLQWFLKIQKADSSCGSKQIVFKAGVEDNKRKSFFAKIIRETRSRVDPKRHHIFRSQYGTIKKFTN